MRLAKYLSFLQFALTFFEMKLLFTMGCLCFCVTTLSAELRNFESADGSKTFSAELIGYDSKTKMVTVILQRKTQNFSIDLLSEDDQKYVIETGKQLAVINNIVITIKEFSENSEKKTSERVEDRVTPSGYVISLNNRSAQDFKKLEVKYTIYYAVQGYIEPDRKVETLTGDLTYDLASNKSKELNTKTVNIVNGKMEPLIENVRRRDQDGKYYMESVVKEPGGRRKDLLQGCAVELLIDGKVVKTITEGKTAEKEPDKKED